MHPLMKLQFLLVLPPISFPSCITRTISACHRPCSLAHVLLVFNPFSCCSLSVCSAPSLDLDMRFFWKWSAFEDYLLFCSGFALLCAVVTSLLLDSPVFVEMLGFLAVAFEAALGLPQLLQNVHNHTTKGMRYDTL